MFSVSRHSVCKIYGWSACHGFNRVTDKNKLAPFLWPTLYVCKWCYSNVTYLLSYLNRRNLYVWCIMFAVCIRETEVPGSDSIMHATISGYVTGSQRCSSPFGKLFHLNIKSFAHKVSYCSLRPIFSHSWTKWVLLIWNCDLYSG